MLCSRPHRPTACDRSEPFASDRQPREPPYDGTCGTVRPRLLGQAQPTDARRRSGIPSPTTASMWRQPGPFCWQRARGCWRRSPGRPPCTTSANSPIASSARLRTDGSTGEHGQHHRSTIPAMAGRDGSFGRAAACVARAARTGSSHCLAAHLPIPGKHGFLHKLTRGVDLCGGVQI